MSDDRKEHRPKRDLVAEPPDVPPEPTLRTGPPPGWRWTDHRHLSVVRIANPMSLDGAWRWAETDAEPFLAALRGELEETRRERDALRAKVQKWHVYADREKASRQDELRQWRELQAETRDQLTEARAQRDEQTLRANRAAADAAVLQATVGRLTEAAEDARDVLAAFPQPDNPHLTRIYQRLNDALGHATTPGEAEVHVVGEAPPRAVIDVVRAEYRRRFGAASVAPSPPEPATKAALTEDEAEDVCNALWQHDHYNTPDRDFMIGPGSFNLATAVMKLMRAWVDDRPGRPTVAGEPKPVSLADELKAAGAVIGAASVRALEAQLAAESAGEPQPKVRYFTDDEGHTHVETAGEPPAAEPPGEPRPVVSPPYLSLGMPKTIAEMAHTKRDEMLREVDGSAFECVAVVSAVKYRAALDEIRALRAAAEPAQPCPECADLRREVGRLDIVCAQLLAVGCVLARDDKGEPETHPRWTPTLGLARDTMADLAATRDALAAWRRWAHTVAYFEPHVGDDGARDAVWQRVLKLREEGFAHHDLAAELTRERDAAREALAQSVADNSRAIERISRAERERDEAREALAKAEERARQANIDARLHARQAADFERQRNEAREVIRGLLLSADCSWEEQGGGHDWPEACEEARQFLADTPTPPKPAPEET